MSLVSMWAASFLVMCLIALYLVSPEYLEVRIISVGQPCSLGRFAMKNWGGMRLKYSGAPGIRPS